MLIRCKQAGAKSKHKAAGGGETSESKGKGKSKKASEAVDVLKDISVQDVSAQLPEAEEEKADNVEESMATDKPVADSANSKDQSKKKQKRHQASAAMPDFSRLQAEDMDRVDVSVQHTEKPFNGQSLACSWLDLV